MQEELLATHAVLAAADGLTVHARARRTGREAAPLVTLRFQCGSVTHSYCECMSSGPARHFCA